MSAFCPHCGYDFERDEPVTIGLAHYDHASGFSYAGRSVHLSPAEKIIVHSLLKANGEVVSRMALAERAGFGEVNDPVNQVAVFLTRIRQRFEEAGIPFFIKSVRGFGLMWAEPAEQAEAA